MNNDTPDDAWCADPECKFHKIPHGHVTMNNDTPRTHPEKLAVDGKGYVWRVFDDGTWSMAPNNPDNSPVPEPITYYVPVAHIEELQAENKRLVELAHQMDTNLNFGTLYAETEAKLQAAERVVEAARRINEATRNRDRDWLGLPPEASDEWVAGFFAALRSLDDNSHIGKCLAAYDKERGTWKHAARWIETHEATPDTARVYRAGTNTEAPCRICGEAVVLDKEQAP